MTTRPHRRGVLFKEALTLIRDGILDLSIAPGEHLNERYLMTRFKISRTPAREALNRLAAEDLVDIHPNRGAFVRPLNATELKELFEALRVAERLACYFCNFDDPELIVDIKHIHDEHLRAVRERRILDISYWYREHRSRIIETSANRHIIGFCYRIFDQMRRVVSLIYRFEMGQADFPQHQLRLLKRYHADVLAHLQGRDRRRLLEAFLAQADTFERRVADALLRSRTIDFLELGRPLSAGSSAGTAPKSG